MGKVGKPMVTRPLWAVGSNNTPTPGRGFSLGLSFLASSFFQSGKTWLFRNKSSQNKELGFGEQTPIWRVSWETPQDSCNPTEQYPTQSKQDLGGAVRVCLSSRQTAPGSDTAVLLRSLWATAHLENKAPDLGEKPIDDTGAGSSRDLGPGIKVRTWPQADLWSRDRHLWAGGSRNWWMQSTHSFQVFSPFPFPHFSAEAEVLLHFSGRNVPSLWYCRKWS